MRTTADRRSQHLLDAVMAAVTDEFTPALEIWKRMDCWAPTTVGSVLRELAEAGRIERTTEPTRDARDVRGLYRKPKTDPNKEQQKCSEG